MPRKRTTTPGRPLLEEIERLKRDVRHLETELFCARELIIDLVPDALQFILRAQIHIDSWKDFYAWQAWAVDGLLHAAHQVAFEQPFNGLRARCPICGGSAQTVYGGEGFSLPVGLTRHLKGSHGSRMCGVFYAAYSMAVERARRHEEQGADGPKWSAPTSAPPWAAPARPQREPSPEEPPAKSADIISIDTARRRESEP